MTHATHAYARNAEECTLAEFVNAERQTEHYNAEYIRLDIDHEERTITAYRATGEAGDRECVSTVIRDVGIALHPSGSIEPESFGLHDREAETFLTWVNALKWERSHARVRFTWYQECGRPMMEGRAVSAETLDFEYRTESGTERVTHIENVWISTGHMCANLGL